MEIKEITIDGWRKEFLAFLDNIEEGLSEEYLKENNHCIMDAKRIDTFCFTPFYHFAEGNAGSFLLRGFEWALSKREHDFWSVANVNWGKHKVLVDSGKVSPFALSTGPVEEEPLIFGGLTKLEYYTGQCVSGMATVNGTYKGIARQAILQAKAVIEQLEEEK